MKSEYSRLVMMMRKQGEKNNVDAPGIGIIKSLAPLIITFNSIDFDNEDLYFLESFFSFESTIIAEVESLDMSASDSHTHEIYNMQLQATLERNFHIGDGILVVPIRTLEDKCLICIDKVVSL